VIRFVLALWLLGSRVAVADDYQAASKLAGDPATVPAAIVAFEAIGDARPTTRWTDNAWSEAGRLAERIGELERARHAYEQVLALTDDAVLRQRARATLARLGGARWDAVRREHVGWVAESMRGDPRAALTALEKLATEQPDYPDRANLWLAIARGWELDGDGERALELLRAAIAKTTGRDQAQLGFAFARIATRGGELDAATAVLDQLAAAPDADRAAIANLREHVETAARRAWIRRGMWFAVAILGGLAAFVLRRETGSWRTTARRLIRPPSEAVFLIPVAGVMVAVAMTGNPVVARALLLILGAGVIVAWISGALFEAHRVRHGQIGARRASAQAVLVIGAIGSVTYLAIDRDRLLDLVEETVEHGPSAD